MWCLVCILSLFLQALASVSAIKRTGSTLKLPIYKRDGISVMKRDGETKAIGLGDFFDVTYSVLMTVGGVTTPLVLDTGSSDLWVVCDSCQAGPCSSTRVPLYPQSTFESTGLPAKLLYGDSLTGTHALGLIGKDGVSLAGTTLQNQLFASINDTNTTVLETGAAGIFGLGFPINSAIWFESFSSEHPLSSHQRRYTSKFPSLNFQSSFPTLGGFRGAYPNDNGSSNATNSNSKPISRSLSPSLSSAPAVQVQPRQESPSPSSSSSWTPIILDSFTQSGPALTRILAQLGLEPTITVTLQRDTVHIGGNAGILTIGGLPEGIDSDSLTWVDIRRYSPADGGLSPPPDAPDEVYPIAWEIPIDDVFLDGQKLPRSSLLDPSISLSALIDTGNSLIRGPRDVVANINSILGGRYPCNEPHTLAFQIGGKMFPVDPRDFGNQVFEDSLEECQANLAATDTPTKGNGYLYSWNLGDPFLKSILASFHYGNISRPSQDPPRFGVISTVTDDPNELFQKAYDDAAKKGNFPAINEPAPTGLPPVSTNSAGIPKAVPTTTESGANGRDPNGAIPGPIMRPLSNVERIAGTALITAGILLS